eukprot:765378-Hanusia_phi.AAC.3
MNLLLQPRWHLLQVDHPVSSRRLVAPPPISTSPPPPPPPVSPLLPSVLLTSPSVSQEHQLGRQGQLQ